jgi:hypothetical protein
VSGFARRRQRSDAIAQLAPLAGDLDGQTFNGAECLIAQLALDVDTRVEKLHVALVNVLSNDHFLWGEGGRAFARLDVGPTLEERQANPQPLSPNVNANVHLEQGSLESRSRFAAHSIPAVVAGFQPLATG